MGNAATPATARRHPSRRRGERSPTRPGLLAALVDGARPWQVFRDVVFPMLAPAFAIVTVLSFILIFRAFDLIHVLSGPQGAPDGATLVIGVLIYGDASGTSGYASTPRMSYAIEGVTLFAFLAGVSALLVSRLGRREEAIH